MIASEISNDAHGNLAKIATYDKYRLTLYDYTNGRTILVDGIPLDPATASITVANIQPFSTVEEFDEAVEIAHVNKSHSVFSSMPPFVTKDFPNGTSHRLLNIVSDSGNTGKRIYVNMNSKSVEPLASPADEIFMVCDAPNPQSCTPGSPKSLPGSATLTFGNWTFQVLTPSSSSGTRGSGVELRNVRYNGKLLLYRAHVPILNVQYDQTTNIGCGPYYRDWQNQEHYLKCIGTDIGPGFRQCNAPAKTILDFPYDECGNFRGVAVYTEGSEFVVKAQMQAGWYRYVSEWRFHLNGTLKPRFGFGGVHQYPYCVCQVHHHHVYWRFDFDIGTAPNNIVREYNTLITTTSQDIIYETKRQKAPAFIRHWEIANTATNDAYALFPGSNDGTSDAYGVGDLWVVKYNGAELDDGVDVTSGDAETTKAHIDRFVNGEPVKDADVVVWYGAHFTHDVSHEFGHIVGPDIRPRRW